MVLKTLRLVSTEKSRWVLGTPVGSAERAGKNSSIDKQGAEQELLWGQVLWQTDGTGSQFLSLLPIVAIFLVFYFLLILPNQRRQKKLQQMLAGLKNGDRVVTNGGIHGTIVGIKDQYIVLRVPPDQVKLEVLRSAIGTVESGEQ